MKKLAIIAIATMLTFVLAACGSSGQPSSSSSSSSQSSSSSSAGAGGQSSGHAGMANPWTDVEAPEAAAEGAGVGYFKVPEDGTEVEGGPIHWSVFRHMENLAEAQGSVGAANLIVRKGLNEESEDVSGDYTEYKFTWEQKADGWKVQCAGNEEGKMMKATWISDNFSYSIMVRGQGSVAETYGLSEADVEALVKAIQ